MDFDVMELKVDLHHKPKVFLPKEILDEHYTGKIFGYRVPNTNIFNVLPLHCEHNEKLSKQIGFINPDEKGLKDRFFTSDFMKCHETGNIDVVTEIQKAAERKKPYDQIISGRMSEFAMIYPPEDGSGWSITGYWGGDNLRLFSMHDGFECEYEVYALKQDVFSRNTGILESDIMQNKGALFIGCGSVGSNAALALAKAGVGRFMLVDSDVFGYHNICRHQCGVYDVGRFKTDALRERILMVNPYAKVVVENMTIQDVPLADIDAFCNENTIVIGGADNREGDLYANGLAKQIGMPFMSIGCWERAFAGEIFYCLPQGMPDYEDFVKVTGTLSGRVTQNRHFYTIQEDLKKVTFEPGISVDIDFVTIIAMKLAIDILNRDNEHYTPRLLPHLTQYTLVCNTNDTRVGGVQAEIFSYPLQVTTSIQVPYAKQQ